MSSDLEQRIRKAALRIDKDSSQVNSVNLSKLLRIKSSSITYYLRNKYRDQIAETNSRLQLQIPCTQALIEDLGIYRGNLYQARLTYGTEIRVSHKDWNRNIRIPLSIDSSLAELIGIYWASGAFATSSTKNSNGDYKKTFVLYGRCRAKDLFRTRVKELIKQHHNIEVNILNFKRCIDGKVYESPRIVIGSQAITSWIMNVLGFPKNKDYMSIPKIEFKDESILKNFLKGVIESSHSWTSNRLAISDQRSKYLFELKKLLTVLGIESSIISRTECNSYRLDISRKGTIKIEELGLTG